ncbi:hypothetical protein PENTCL1PPCAC_23680, partial [Pristionchus entomophagus]
ISLLLLISSIAFAVLAIPHERFRRGSYGRPSGYGAPSYGDNFGNQGGFDSGFDGSNFNQFPNNGGNFNNGGQFSSGGFNVRVRRGYGRPSGYGAPSYGDNFGQQGGFDSFNNGGFNTGGSGFNQFPNNGGSLNNGGQFSSRGFNSG